MCDFCVLVIKDVMASFLITFLNDLFGGKPAAIS